MKPQRHRVGESDTERLNSLTGAIIGAAIEVHATLGPGLLESVYKRCMSMELGLRGIDHRVEAYLPVVYKGVRLENAFRVDVVAGVQDDVLVEFKSVEAITFLHEAQLLTYLKLSQRRLGLLINFNVDLLKKGIRRLAN